MIDEVKCLHDLSVTVQIPCQVSMKTSDLCKLTTGNWNHTLFFFSFSGARATLASLPGPRPGYRTASDGKLGERLGTRLSLPSCVLCGFISCTSFFMVSCMSTFV